MLWPFRTHRTTRVMGIVFLPPVWRSSRTISYGPGFRNLSHTPRLRRSLDFLRPWTPGTPGVTSDKVVPQGIPDSNSLIVWYNGMLNGNDTDRRNTADAAEGCDITESTHRRSGPTTCIQSSKFRRPLLLKDSMLIHVRLFVSGRSIGLARTICFFGIAM